ncbi:NAD(P)-binding protein [Cohaesibacter celericrescens]|uniref:Glutamate synthase n=1 Tax=Cohaesibacter celericrescens TaxID=2067669 RepID=A0A2N5XTG9_9HYPH|nr:NAD(P)-binding protein [Cohaesibacter celericrescens]PLW77826.1 glutamate synthase [Cohaesibacter celericrescens]
MSSKHQDFTPVVDLTIPSGAGPTRQKKPRYVTLTPPCSNVCPAGENIREWLSAAQAGDYHKAWEILTAENPMPAVHGRVCYHPCEQGCNRGQVDDSVSIHAVERFLGDLANKENWAFKKIRPDSGKKILIVGAGPSGLSAAYHLARLGHEVEIFEAGPIAGGMMHFGIPAYRMPREELAQEVARIEALGVKIVTNHKVTDLLEEMELGSFDAAYIAIGAGMSRRVDIPARDAVQVLDAVNLLHDTSDGHPPLLGRRVIVYGGGNTAMDAARTAKRLGAAETMIVYRRDREHMPAHDFEADEAMAEGVKIKWLTTIKEIQGSELTVERMEIDETGRPQPTGEFDTLSADAVVLALGQQTESTFLNKVPGLVFSSNGTVVVGPNQMTDVPGVFAGGDMVPGDQSVTIATGHGKKGARHIDAWLAGTTYQEPLPTDIVTFDKLNLPVYSDADSSEQAEVSAKKRVENFGEVLSGLTEEEARYEAQRCYSCGDCYECDNCLAACPEGAIIKLGRNRGYTVDWDKCTGCSVCYDQCPCHAIDMIMEARPNV